MTRLLPYQERLLERLTTDPVPDRVLVSGPAGAGVSTVLVQAAARTASAGGTVIVLIQPAALLDQWVERLRAAGIGLVRSIRKSEDAVLTLDESGGGSVTFEGAIVVLERVLRSGAGRRAAKSFAPTLLIVERPSSPSLSDAPQGDARYVSGFDVTAAQLAGQADRVVVATNEAGEVPWLGPAERVEVSLAEALTVRPADLSLVVARYQASGREVDLRNRAVALVGQVTDLSPSLSTRPALHSTLMRMAARLSRQSPESSGESSEPMDTLASASGSSLLESAWKLIDQVEALGADPRLECLLRLTEAATVQGRPVLIIADRVDEAEYVAGALRDFGKVRVISGASDQAQRRRAWSELEGGMVLVATRPALQGFDQPPDTEQLWWSSPRGAADVVVRLSRVTEGGRAVAIVADPPSGDDERLLEVIARIRQEGLLRVSIVE